MREAADRDAAFEPFATKMRAEGLPELAIRTFRYYYEQLRAGQRGTLSRAEIDPVDEMPSLESVGDVRAAGETALPRTVVIKLNGGLGTSMGMTTAKSLLPVKEGLTFLDVTARQIEALGARCGCAVPLVLMNSFRTRDDSLSALGRYGNLSSDLPPDFLQHKVPRIRADDLTPIEWPSEPAYEWAPPGHGDIYTALLSSGMLGRLLDAGYRTAFVSNADNLGAVLDLDLLGWFVASGAPFAMEVKRRTHADRKGGHLARLRDGRLTLREIAQCPEEERAHFEDVELYRFFNTNNLWLDLEALSRELARREAVLGLPMIRNEKTVDPRDARSPKVIQLETAMGAAISVFEGALAIQVPSHRFAPVKTTNDLLAIRSDAYVLSDDYRILPTPGGHAGDLVVDLDPRFFKVVADLEAHFPHGPPSLKRCTRLEVRGDVRFGRDVVAVGDVVLETEGTLDVPDGSRLGGSEGLRRPSVEATRFGGRHRAG